MDSEAMAWAETEVLRLRNTAANQIGTIGSLAATLEFLRVHAGESSSFTHLVRRIVEGEIASAWARAGDVADALDGWIAYVKSGLSIEAPPRVQARFTASNDLMEQVQTLLDDTAVHVAAPVMLAGAALEELLRSLLLAGNIVEPEKPSLNAYATTLRHQNLISAQDVKNVTAWAGIRNDAAHGHFEKITYDQARLMAMGVNLFMQQRRPDGPAQPGS